MTTHDLKVSSKCLVSLPHEEDQSSSYFVTATKTLRQLNEVRYYAIPISPVTVTLQLFYLLTIYCNSNVLFFSHLS